MIINVEKSFGKIYYLFIIQNKTAHQIWNRKELKADNYHT